MKAVVVSLLLLSALPLPRTGATLALPTGAYLPNADEPLRTACGQETTLHQAMGTNGLLIMFTSNVCPYVLRNQARTNTVCQYAQAHHIGVILLNANEADREVNESLHAMQVYAEAQGFKWPYALDKDSHLADVFGADHTPDCFLFDKDSRLVYSGGIDDNPGNAAQVKVHYLQNALEALAEGKSISDHKGDDVGCSVKRK
ncbi:redoxin family protein [Chitinophaga parva]|nr:redoxin family protein [Chitinophaga parva]